MSITKARAFAIGFLTALLARWSPHSHVRLLILVGFLGGYTTFSTFSLDVAVLYERGQVGLAALYVLLSVALSIGGLFAGLTLLRSLS